MTEESVKEEAGNEESASTEGGEEKKGKLVDVSSAKESVQEEPEAPAENEASEEGNSEQIFEERPESDDSEDKLLAGKYKTVEDLEAGYKELSSKLREKQPEAPEEYNFNFSESETFKDLADNDNLNLDLSDDPLLKAVEPVFKEHGISQEAAEKLVRIYVDEELESTPDPKKEMEKLGSDAEKITENVGRFVAKNFGEDEHSVLEDFASTAKGVKILDKISKMVGEKNIPAEADPAPRRTPDELMQEAEKIRKDSRDFSWDTAAKRRYDEIMTEAAKRELSKK